MIYLLHAQFVPEKHMAELMSDLFAVQISTANIAAMGQRTARRFEDFPGETGVRIGTGRGDVGEGILVHDDYATCFTLRGCAPQGMQLSSPA